MADAAVASIGTREHNPAKQGMDVGAARLPLGGCRIAFVQAVPTRDRWHADAITVANIIQHYKHQEALMDSDPYSILTALAA